MKPDHAALVAQIIPVVALAAGIELRDFARRLAAALSHDSDENDDWIRVWPAYLLCLVMVVLAVAECYVLGGALGLRWEPPMGGGDDGLLMGALRAAILVTFVGPAWDAGYVITRARWPFLAQQPRSYYAANGVFIVLMLALIATGYFIDDLATTP